MFQDWYLLLKSFSLEIQEKLSLFSEYFQNRNFQNTQVIILDEPNYTLSITHSEVIIIITSDTQINVDYISSNEEVSIDVIVLDGVNVSFIAYRHVPTITYRFFVGSLAHLNFFLAFIDDTKCHAMISCHLVGHDAQASLQSAYVLNATQTITLLTEQHHHAPYTKSDLVLRGFVTDSAQSIHQGMVTIDNKAQQTKASQYNKTLLGSMNAQAKSVSSLEINAHDVRCQHGSAIGYLDEQQLFYLKSRGLDESIVQKMLIEAFFAGLDESLLNVAKQKLKKIF